MSYRHKSLRRSAIAAIVMTWCASAGSAVAATQTFYSIPRGSLSVALRLFARQTDREVFFNEKLLAGRRTPGMSGSATAEEALKILLARSGFEVAVSRSGTLLVVPEAEASSGEAKTSLPAQAFAGPPSTPGNDVWREAAPATNLIEPSILRAVVVTGSLVVRDGYRSPTPVTMVDAGQLSLSAASNFSDGLNQLPLFSGSRSQSQSAQNSTAITPAAGNYLNLRNLGIVRSLILFDGQRVPPTSFEGIVDTNVLPQALIKRVDVVTAGASAAYGSDAVTGVINFVLDKTFTGIKGSIQKGGSSRNDDASERIVLAAGGASHDDRFHYLLSGEHYASYGIKDKASRPLYSSQPIAYGNGSTIPYRTELNARTSTTSTGGVILSGPLALQKFESDGSLTPFDQGSKPVVNGIQIGGDGGRALGGSLVGALRTDQLFARGAYNASNGGEVFLQASFGESRNRYSHNGADNRIGNLTIFSGNAFLPASAQAVLDSTDTGSFLLGRQGLEQGRKIVDVLNDSTSVFAGVKTPLSASWNVALNYSGGISYMRAKHTRNPENQRYFAAIDAVKDPKSGQIVCRVTLIDPSLYPGCQPLNILGADRASPEAIEYVFGQDSQYNVKNTLQDLSLNFVGTLLTLPAGPISAAIGAEVRTQSLKQDSNADPASPVNTTGLRGFPSGQGRFGNTNQGVAHGSQNVREMYAEAVAPIFTDRRFAKSLELNGAVRFTDYSTTGLVETWKLGFGYVPQPGLRIRATTSLDIRTPTLNELYAGAQVSSQAFTDVHTGRTSTITTVSRGALSLQPEVGRTQTIGVLYRPEGLNGFSASIDYYDISIEGAITAPTTTQVNEDCEASLGLSTSCNLIFRPNPFSDRSPANAVQRIDIAPRNIAEILTSGFDIEAGIVTAFGDGSLSMRMLANYVSTYRTRDTPTSPVRDRAGVGGDQLNSSSGNPKLRGLINVVYRRGSLTVNLQERYIGKITRSLTDGVYDDNVIKPVLSTNLGLALRMPGAGRNVELFTTVNNLWNRSPPLVPYISEPGLRYPTLQGLYDVIGRYYTIGFRMSM